MCSLSEEWASTLVKGLLKRNFLHNLQIPTSSCGWLQLSNMVTSLPQPVHMKDGAASLTLILSSLCIIATLTSHPSPFDRCFSSLTSICMQIFQNLSLKTSENHFAFLLQKSCALKAMESFHLYLPLKKRWYLLYKSLTPLLRDAINIQPSFWVNSCKLNARGYLRKNLKCCRSVYLDQHWIARFLCEEDEGHQLGQTGPLPNHFLHHV